jgi:predicted amidophosphoribosyltransferase
VAGLPPVIALARYAGGAREVVLAYKERGRRDLVGLLAEHVGDALTALEVPPAAIVPAPSRPSAARARGGDHMRRLARAVVDRSTGPGRAGVPCVAPALALGRGARDSVGLDADARAGNLARHLRLRPAGLPPPGCAVVLLDDVATTGATARAGVALLERAGRRPDAIVVLTVAASLTRP